MFDADSVGRIRRRNTRTIAAAPQVSAPAMPEDVRIRAHGYCASHIRCDHTVYSWKGI